MLKIDEYIKIFLVIFSATDLPNSAALKNLQKLSLDIYFIMVARKELSVQLQYKH